MDNIKISELEKKFYSLCEVFDNNLNILTFAIKYFDGSKIRPNTILQNLEYRRLNTLAVHITNLSNMNESNLLKFATEFKKISHFDDFEVYKIFYSIICKNIKQEQELLSLKKKIRTLSIKEKQFEATSRKIEELEKTLNYYKRNSLF